MDTTNEIKILHEAIQNHDILDDSNQQINYILIFCFL